jgi:hypothetical protein
MNAILQPSLPIQGNIAVEGEGLWRGNVFTAFRAPPADEFTRVCSLS